MRYFIPAFLLLFLLGCSIKTKAPAGADGEDGATPSKESGFQLDYEKFTLDNGLEVVLHVDKSDPIVALSTVVHVGSNREKPGRTGFAHFFEHMSFNDSENVPRGWNRKAIPEWGGVRNGGTWSDGTIYYEQVPTDAFDKILWVDSDRLGYMINTVTEAALEREKQVVKNEKRQRVDNNPYGYTDEVIRKNLYPEGHPYSWTVIGSLPDLQAATLEDVKEFYEQFYGPNNATLAIAGDIDIEETKNKVKAWFGEIKRGPEVEKMAPMPVTLTDSKRLYFEDNFAKLPELRITYPSAEALHEDEQALAVLAQILAGSKNAPLYKGIVESAKLAPNVGVYNRAQELAGEFVIRVRANEGVDLDEVKAAIDGALARFEVDGVSEKELKRIKAEQETALYYEYANVLGKANAMASANEFSGDPARGVTEAKLLAAVTRDDVMRVYNKYIKDKHSIMTSFVPKGEADLSVSGSELAEVWIEEVKDGVANEEVSQGEEAEYVKTPTAMDRSEPPFGDLPLVKMPEIWEGKAGSVPVLGIYNDEVPLIVFDITIHGGSWLDPLDKKGISGLMTDLMMQGTANRTPAELEEAIGLLGSFINVTNSTEEIRISAACLARNFEETVALVQEILLEPRWDEAEYNRLISALKTELKGREANPQSIGSLAFYKLLYGNSHPLGLPNTGTLETVENISLEDVKRHYLNLVPYNSTIHIAGAIDTERAKTVLTNLVSNWKSDAAAFAQPVYSIPPQTNAGKVFFIDVPGSKQSVINIGKLALSKKDPNANNLAFTNDKLGGGSSGALFQTLRIEKGYTYGAYSSVSDGLEIRPFGIRTSVRANATKASLDIIKDMVTNYARDFTEDDVKTTKQKLVKANTRAFESLDAKIGTLHDISKYGLSKTYVEDDQKELVEMDLEDFQNMANTYMQEEEMIYVIVGDKETQWDAVNEFAGGDVIELDIYGNVK